MQLQHKFDMELKQLDLKATKEKEAEIQGRKEKSSKQEATQQSKMIAQRQNDEGPIDFNNQDGMNMEAFA